MVHPKINKIKLKALEKALNELTRIPFRAELSPCERIARIHPIGFTIWVDSRGDYWWVDKDNYHNATPMKVIN